MHWGPVKGGHPNPDGGQARSWSQGLPLTGSRGTLRAKGPYWRKTKMSRVALNQAAPDFSLPDFTGKVVRLSDFLGRKNVLLVFNRTFM